MGPQKWTPRPGGGRAAEGRTPPPLTASTSRPTRARKPRRDVASATASLSTNRSGRRRDQALELEERVERSLREHLAVWGEDERVRAARNHDRLPGLRVQFLVERLQLDLGIAGDEAQGRLERLAEGAAG